MKGRWSFTEQQRPLRELWRALAVPLLLLALLLVWFGSAFVPASGLATDLAARNLPPGWPHLFGTDWLGRDMLARVWKGLGLSLQVGLTAACASGLLAAGVALFASLSRMTDRLAVWLMDLFLSVPHLVTLILLAFVFGGGVRGVVLGIALTHWPTLARVLRAELLQLKEADYVRVSRRLGRSRWWVGTRHLLPHVLPQLAVGVLLLFPHAILHEAAITFLGLGLSAQQPAVGIILSEAMRYLTAGYWWLAVFPGLSLLAVVLVFHQLGERVKRRISPGEVHF